MKQNEGKAPNQRLSHERTLHGWSQEDVASKLGTSTYTVAQWENGVAFPNLHYRQKLCELFETNAQELGFIEGKTEEASRVTQTESAPGSLSQSDTIRMSDPMKQTISESEVERRVLE